jgi:hypothetical protein
VPRTQPYKGMAPFSTRGHSRGSVKLILSPLTHRSRKIEVRLAATELGLGPLHTNVLQRVTLSQSSQDARFPRRTLLYENVLCPLLPHFVGNFLGGIFVREVWTQHPQVPSLGHASPRCRSRMLRTRGDR